MVKKRVDDRVQGLIESGVKYGHRSLFCLVGDHGKDQVENLHRILSKSRVKSRPSVLWCYKKELGFSTHRQKRMKEIKRNQARGLHDPDRDDPFDLFISSTNIRWTYYKESEKILGQTFGMCVLQDFEAITPNLLARTIETVEGGGGRVFFTSTDQDGNFRVGDLFSVEQATGIASLNADAFNISGLQELQLGDLALGGTSASINEFSTDGTMAANSDAIVPTQRAIRTYIASQIGGGASSLNVNLITAGLVVITGNTISTSNNVGINFQSVTNFTKGVTGVPIAMNYLIHS